MRSSGSTRPPSRRAKVALWLAVAGEDHPKACTGRRLLRRRLALPAGFVRRPRHPPILLDPHAALPLSPADRAVAEAGGVVAVDCSWNRLADRGGYPAELGGLRGLGPRRRLPFLIAANPQHFGRLAELNTAEALGAALYVLGEARRAAEVLAVSPGGATFLALNRERLEGYASAADAAGVRGAEARFF